MNHTEISHARAMSLRIIAAMLIALACTLAVSTYKYFGHTWDEPEHIAAGMQLLDRNLYTYDQQHPPLARLAMAIGPYLAGARSFGEPGPSGEQEGRDLLYRTGKYDLLLTRARLGMLPFLVVLLGATWAWTRHSFGLAPAALAVFFLVATPPILGHSAVAALDIPGAALCTLAFYLLLRWLETGGWRLALAAGLASGLAIGSKLSSLPFIAIVGLTWTVMRLWRWPRGEIKSMLVGGRWWSQAAGITGVALLAAIFCYGFTFKYLVSDANPHSAALDYVFGAQGALHNLSYAIAREVPLPAGVERLIWSIEALIKHNTEGHLSYLLGHFSTSGFREFYVVALGVKTPLPLLLLGGSGLIFLGWRGRHDWTLAAPLTAFAALLLFCSFYSHINIGIRHVFMLYPLLAIAAANFTIFLWQRHAALPARAVLVLLYAAQGATLWTAYPDYLPYFNVLVGQHPERVLIDSDLDWGQDVKRLQRRLIQRGIHKFGFVYRGSADVIGERLPGVWMVQPFNPATGWIAASIYARDTVAQGAAFAWLRHHRPVERIGKSIDLYFIPEVGKPAGVPPP